jgi:Uma2 family endonuclease
MPPDRLVGAAWEGYIVAMSASREAFTAVSIASGKRFEERYLRAPSPLYFPEEEEVPESKRHLELRTLLYQLLKLAFADRAAIGCDQFVYWDPTDPRACLAPDAFVRLDQPDDLFPTWKVWERGAPHVAVEIASRSDGPEPEWQPKLEKYRRLGVNELLRFDPLARERPLRVWDSIEQDLVEREVAGHCARSHCLPGFWLLVDQPELGLTLRLSHDERGERLYPTPAEYEAGARRAEAEGLQQRVRELEALLAGRNT